MPVIFHVIAVEGQKAPDDEQIRYQLDVLNKCFGSYEPEKPPYMNEAVEKFTSLGANPVIVYPGSGGEVDDSDNGDDDTIIYKP